MSTKKFAVAVGTILFSAATLIQPAVAQDNGRGGSFKHVLLVSVDGMHAVDYLNCSQGVSGVNGGQPYCPNLAKLAPLP